MGGDLALSEVAERIHAATGLPVLADSFAHTHLNSWFLRSKTPLRKVLNSLEIFEDYRWKLSDGVLLLRNKQFYRDRPREIPYRVRAPWRERLIAQGIFSLDDLGEIASVLTAEQFRNLVSYWYWQFDETPPGRNEKVPQRLFPGPPYALEESRYHLRFWHTLSAAQKSLLQTGILPLRKLTKGQQRLIHTAVVGPPWDVRPNFRNAPPSLEKFATGGLSVTLSREKPPVRPVGKEGDPQRREPLPNLIQFRYFPPGGGASLNVGRLSLSDPPSLEAPKVYDPANIPDGLF